MTPDHSHYSWQLVDAALAAVDGDVVDVALSRSQATLWYGSHCFEFTNVVEASGECLLRLEEVGRRAETGTGPTVMLFVENGYRDEQRIAPCRGTLAESALRDIDARVLCAIGQSLFADVARVMDTEDVT